MQSKLLVLFLVFISCGLVSLHSGSAEITWRELFHFLTAGGVPEEKIFLLQALRVPRTFAALIIGGCLGSAGLVLQTLLRNPLAEPYTLGLSGGSSLGAVIALILGIEPLALWIPVLSTTGCLLAVFIVLGFGSRKLQFESRSLILLGVMTSLFFGALVVTGLSTLSADRMQAALFWLLGEFGTSRDVWIKILGPVLMSGIVVLFWRAPSLDVLSLGEARAMSLGFSPRSEKIFYLFLCSLLTALSVSISGLVGFVGLVSPHLARRFLKTANHRYLLVASFLLGGSLLTLADSLARSLSRTGEIPAGSIAALLGAPVLIFLLSGRGYASAE